MEGLDADGSGEVGLGERNPQCVAIINLVKCCNVTYRLTDQQILKHFTIGHLSHDFAWMGSSVSLIPRFVASILDLQVGRGRKKYKHKYILYRSPQNLIAIGSGLCARRDMLGCVSDL